MNYFSHYYFDRRVSDSYHNFGLVLPDFVRNFMKGQKCFALKEIPDQPSHFQSLGQGQNSHFYRDKVFHSCDYFKKKQGQLNEILKPIFAQYGMKRYWFAGHVLCEILIDRVLIKEDPALLDNFYRELGDCDLEQVHAFLLLQGINDRESLLHRMQRFFEYEYLKKYVDDMAVAYALSRICLYAGIASEWSENQTEEIARWVHTMESIIFEELDDLKDQMK